MSAPRTALREAVEQSPGRCHGQPFGRILETQTVTRTTLREDPRNSNSKSDSPSGGTLKQLLGQKDQTYDLSTGLHTYGVIYPAGLRRPKLVPTGTQTAFRLYETISWEEERKLDNAWHVYESKG